MKKIISLVLAMVLVLSSMSALAAGVAPATGTSPIKATVEVKERTITVTLTEAPFDASDDVTLLFYAPESATSDNIIEENIIHADQIDYVNVFSFTVGADVAAGTYNLLIGGTDVDIPCLVKVEIKETETPDPGEPDEPDVPEVTVVKGDLNGDKAVAIADLTSLARFLAGFAEDVAAFEANPALKEAADVNQSGDVSVADLTKLARFLAGFTGVDLNDAQ